MFVPFLNTNFWWIPKLGINFTKTYFCLLGKNLTPYNILLQPNTILQHNIKMKKVSYNELSGVIYHPPSSLQPHAKIVTIGPTTIVQCRLNLLPWVAVASCGHCIINAFCLASTPMSSWQDTLCLSSYLPSAFAINDDGRKLTWGSLSPHNVEFMHGWQICQSPL